MYLVESLPQFSTKTYRSIWYHTFIKQCWVLQGFLSGKTGNLCYTMMQEAEKLIKQIQSTEEESHQHLQATLFLCTFLLRWPQMLRTCVPPLTDTSQQQCATLTPLHNTFSTFKPSSSIFPFTKPSRVINSKVHWPHNRHNRCNCLQLFHFSIISQFQRLPSNR